MHSSTTTNLFHLSLQVVATQETQIKKMHLVGFLYTLLIRCVMAISVAAITMCGSKLIQDHNLLVNVVKLGGKSFNITGTSFPLYYNGPSPRSFF